MNSPTGPPADSATSTYDELYDLNRAIARKYHQHLISFLDNPASPVARYVASRGISRAQCEHWQLGYAPKDWRFLTDALIEKGAFEEAVALGVCVTDGDRNRDFFRDRLIIPIYNEQARIVGFTGRSIGKPHGDLPKYMNIRTTVLYEKSTTLYGIHKALRAMKLGKPRQAVLTEGNLDVTSLHLVGIDNAVGKGGTALTDQQTDTLARLVETVTLIYDTDAAGQKALYENLEKLLLRGLRVKIFRLPEGLKDADEWVQWVLTVFDTTGLPRELLLKQNEFVSYLASNSEDGLMVQVKRLLATDILDEKIAGMRKVEALLAAVRDGHWRQEYIKMISKEFKIPAKELVKNVEAAKAPDANEASDDDTEDWPDWVDVKALHHWGFAKRVVPGNTKDTGYYFSAHGRLESRPVTNFVLDALYHIKDRGNVRRLALMDNGLKKVIIEINAKALNAVQAFEELVTSEGWFNTTASFKREHQKRILNEIMASTPEVYPIKTLGWQPEGFFAYSNAVYNGHLEQYNEYGVVKVYDQHFFSPSRSPIFANYREESDEYKFDKYLTYAPSPITFSHWARQMMTVYGDRAMVGAVFAVTSLFKDVVRKSSKIPHLYCYGPKDSGKSTFAESILYLFFGGRDTDGELIKPLNLGSMPTGPAFWATMARFRNCPMLFNEFDDTRIADQFFTAFKAAWDGEGRIRGTMDKGKTEEQSVNCSIMIVGQYLSSKDDGSVTSRSLAFEFKSRKDNPFTAEEIRAYDVLRDWQKGNLSGILTDMLPHRELMVKHFQPTIRAIKTELTESFAASNEKFASRTFENVTCLLATYEVLKDVIDWPFSKEELWVYCRKLIADMSAMMQESDALSKFWSMMAFLLDRGEVIDNWDFKVVTEMQVKLRVSYTETRVQVFEKPRRLLYVRVGNVHKPYAEAYRRQSGEKSMAEDTLRIYMKQQSYFIGENPGSYFKGNGKSQSSSALVFDYDHIERTGISLERQTDEEPGQPQVMLTIAGLLTGEVKPILAGTGTLIQFALLVTMQTSADETPGGLPLTEQYRINCFSADLAHGSLTPGAQVSVTGAYQETKFTDREGKPRLTRKLDVTRLELLASPAVYDDGFRPTDIKPAPF